VEAAVELDGEYPVIVPPFMDEIVEQMSIVARRSKYVDHESGVSARFTIANYRTMIANARQRAIRLGEKPAVPRISDLAHLYSSSLGKLELDLMGSHQMSERQVLDAVMAEAIREVATLYKEGILKKPAGYSYAFPDLLTFHDSPTPIENRLFVMHLKHRMRAFQGVFHANPDYALWYGWNEMQMDLVEIRAMAEEMRRLHANAKKK